jgi:hypothetical protein
MPRQETPAVEPIGPSLPTTSPSEILDDAAKVEAQRLALADLDNRYGLTGPYDRDALLRSAQTLIVESGIRILMLGRVFLLLKAHEADGEWLTALDQLGVSPRFAQRCMQTARKLEGSESRKLLAAQLSSSKVMELTVLDDDDLDAVAGGSLEGLKLDDIDRMSIRELRLKLREIREERSKESETHGEIVAAKYQKINDLDKKLRYWGKTPARERAEAILQDAALASVEMVGVATRIETAIRSARAVFDESGESIPADVEALIGGLSQPIFEQLHALNNLIGP